MNKIPTSAKENSPEKWTVDACRDASGNWTIRKADGTGTGNIDCEPIATVYTEADAHLISAAPELLDSVENLVGMVQCYVKHLRTVECPGYGLNPINDALITVNNARTAIAKAKGITP